MTEGLLVVALEEREHILRAVAEMRLAAVSQDYDRADVLWRSIEPALAAIAKYVLKQADAFVMNVNKAVAAGIGVAMLITLAWAIGLLNNADAIGSLLKLIHPG